MYFVKSGEVIMSHNEARYKAFNPVILLKTSISLFRKKLKGIGKRKSYQIIVIC